MIWSALKMWVLQREQMCREPRVVFATVNQGSVEIAAGAHQVENLLGVVQSHVVCDLVYDFERQSKHWRGVGL